MQSIIREEEPMRLCIVEWDGRSPYQVKKGTAVKVHAWIKCYFCVVQENGLGKIFLTC